MQAQTSLFLQHTGVTSNSSTCSYVRVFFFSGRGGFITVKWCNVTTNAPKGLLYIKKIYNNTANLAGEADLPFRPAFTPRLLPVANLQITFYFSFYFTD